MNAESYLIQVRKLDQLINAKLAERDRWEALATDISPKPISGMPHTNTGIVPQTMQNAVINLVMLSQEIDRLIDECVDKKQAVLKVLEQLPDKEYGVLHRYYIRNMTLEQIAEDMGYSVRQIHRIKEKALKNLEDVIECHAKK